MEPAPPSTSDTSASETPGMASRLLRGIDHVRDALLANELSVLGPPDITDVVCHAAPNGSTVIALTLADTVRKALPPNHRHLDLFLLDPGCRLGTHYHVHATAHIHVLAGNGHAEVDGVHLPFSAGAHLLFPAGSRHDVIANDHRVLFASFQDNPIIQPDGSLDYHTD